MQLADLEIFHTVANLGSFTKAAEALGHSKAHVSRRISALEAQLNVKLLNRTTRALHLTEAGQLCLALAHNVATTVDHGLEQLDTLRQHPHGRLKISIPPAFGEHVLAPLWPQFLQAYPDILLDIHHNTHLVDVIGEGFDLVLRRAVLPDSSLIARKLCEPKQLLVASPTYLKKHGNITSTEDLRHHQCINYSGQPNGHWRVIDHRLCQEIAVPINTILTTDSVNTVLDLVLAGCGISVLPNFMVEPLIQQDKLIHCLAHTDAISHPVYIVYPSREHLPLKTQVLIEFLQQHVH